MDGESAQSAGDLRSMSGALGGEREAGASELVAQLA